MDYTIQNDGLGFSTAISNTYAIIGNPSFASSTGSIEVYKKDASSNSYNYTKTYNLHLDDLPIFLASEFSGTTSSSIATENLNLLTLDINESNISYINNTFGKSLDISNNIMVIGNLETSFVLSSTTIPKIFYESASVKIYDLSNNSDYPIYTIYPDEQFNNLYQYYYTGSLPPNFDCVTSGSNFLPENVWSVESASWSQNTLLWANESVSSLTNISFGASVSINGNILAIGSPYTCNGRGIVYVYENIASDWVFQQALIGSETTTGTFTNGVFDNSGSLFGGIVKIDKNTNSIIVGTSNRNSVNNKVYLYNYNSGSNMWEEDYIFIPNRNIAFLNFINSNPYNTDLTMPDSFGTAIGINGSTVVIGAPTDRYIQEYSGSNYENNGAVYIYEKCDTADYYILKLKTYGESNTTKDNLFGYSIDINNNTIIVGSPQNNIYKSINYIQNTLDRYNDTNIADNNINGQLYIMNKDVNDNWSFTDSISKKKDYKSNYKNYGQSVYLYNNNIIVGSPLLISDQSRILSSSYDDVSEIRGDFYIYDYLNRKNNVHFGNVFYPNGKIIVSPTQSIFNNILTSELSDENLYDLNLKVSNTVYEKEIMCVVNPNEFNYSTNPTSLIYNTIPVNYYNLKAINFKTVDTLLRYMMYKISNNTTEHWWLNIIFEDIDNAFFKFYTTSGIVPDFIPAIYSDLDLKYNDILDINNDGIITLDDISLLWSYFIYNLNNSNYTNFIDSSCTRNNLQILLSYMDNITGKYQSPLVNPLFFINSQSSSLNPTGSYLTPYITTIGLYSGIDIVGIAKLGTPIKHVGDFPLNFSIRFDI